MSLAVSAGHRASGHSDSSGCAVRKTQFAQDSPLTSNRLHCCEEALNRRFGCPARGRGLSIVHLLRPVGDVGLLHEGYRLRCEGMASIVYFRGIYLYPLTMVGGVRERWVVTCCGRARTLVGSGGRRL